MAFGNILAPIDFSEPSNRALSCARVLANGALFAVGAARSLVTASRWWISGFEMLGLGVLVAVVAYATGAGIALVIQNGAG